jgi:signal peptidase I
MTPSDMNYTGPSMNPTLKAGDGLSVIPYRNRRIQIGDVVVFPHPERSYNVVHRVVAVDSRGVRTRGDNSINMDLWILNPVDIIGRVVSAKRENRSVTIQGGALGIIFAPILWTIKKVNLSVSRILHPIYHWLAGSGILIEFNWFLPKIHALSFNRPEGREFQLLMGNRVIGRRLPGKDHWQIARPFRLFVDETSLPC